jgi:thermitase
VIVNGGFESGSASWTESSSGGYELIDTTRPHTGAYSAYLGGYNNGTDSVYQTVSIPAGATSANLSYWSYMTSSEGTGTPYDYLYVEVRSTGGTLLGTLRTQNNTGTRGSWLQTTNLSLLPWKGQTVRVQFRATTDSSLITSFFVDDVVLNSCN